VLSRGDELRIALEMSRSRRRFRISLLANEPGLRGVIGILEGIERGQLRLDRYIDVAVTDLDEKRRVRSILGSILVQLRSIRADNLRNFRIAVSRKLRLSTRLQAWKRVVLGRHRAAMLVEKVNLRTNKISSLLQSVRATHSEMQRLQTLLRFAREECADCRVVHRIAAELRNLMLENLDSPATMERRLKIVDEHRSRYLDLRRQLTSANLRFVIAVARRYQNRGLALPDLIQEGTVGLIRAIEKFDPSRGYRLMTYAERWIRQEIILAIAKSGGAISIPPTLNKAIREVRISTSLLLQSTGREPRSEEIAHHAGLTIKQTEDIVRLQRRPMSLDRRVRGSDGRTFVEIVEQRQESHRLSEERHASMQHRIQEVMEVLNPREREILRLRYGLGDGVERTLAEIGRRFSLSKERIRQIQNRAVEKLQHPACRNALDDFVDDSHQQSKSSVGVKPR